MRNIYSSRLLLPKVRELAVSCSGMDGLGGCPREDSGAGTEELEYCNINGISDLNDFSGLARFMLGSK